MALLDKNNRIQPLALPVIAPILIITVFFCYLISVPASAGNAEKPEFEINTTMLAIGKNMAKLFPVLFRDDEFKALENKKLIQDSIDNILALFENAGPHFQSRTITFKTSFEVLEEHLRETRKAFEGGNSGYAQQLLKEAVSICTSCHTQDKKERTLFKETSRKSFTRDFEYAEFSFMTRNYGDAIKYYDNFLASPHEKATENEMLTALKRELTIFAQVYNDPGQGADHLREHLSKDKLTPYVQRNVTEWIKGLRELEGSNVFIENAKDFASLEALVHEYLGPMDNPGTTAIPSKKEVVFHVWLRGLLYTYLNKNPTQDEIPKILYWLSMNDRATNYSYYYSLADLYLQECMLIFTKHPYAKKCYEEYKEYIEFSYSGSLGTEIPDDLKKELETLHRKVYGS